MQLGAPASSRGPVPSDLTGRLEGHFEGGRGSSLCPFLSGTLNETSDRHVSRVRVKANTQAPPGHGRAPALGGGSVYVRNIRTVETSTFCFRWNSARVSGANTLTTAWAAWGCIRATARVRRLSFGGQDAQSCARDTGPVAVARASLTPEPGSTLGRGHRECEQQLRDWVVPRTFGPVSSSPGAQPCAPFWTEQTRLGGARCFRAFAGVLRWPPCPAAC